MKKNKILIGVISIMFAGIITLGIIECNNSNTKDNDKLFMGNGKFCQAKRLNGLGARHKHKRVLAIEQIA